MRTLNIDHKICANLSTGAVIFINNPKRKFDHLMSSTEALDN